MASFRKDLFNAPNIMSLSRIALTPILTVFWLGLDWKAAGLVLGTLIGLTDLADGVVARRLHKITDLGGLLDQVGDLIFEATVLIMAVSIGGLWVGWLIAYLMREFIVSTARSYVVSKGGSLPSTMLGKAKSNYLQWAFFIFFTGIILLDPGMVPASASLVGVPPGRLLMWVAEASMITGIVIGLVSGFIYLKGFAAFYTGRSTQPSEARHH
jgi:phosphatidylglycerophosphate synthase